MSDRHRDRARARPRAAARDAPHPPLRGALRRALQRRARSAASCTSTSARRRSRSARCRRSSPTTRSSPPTASTATRSPAASRAGALMAEMFGSVEGCSRGRGGSMHLFDAAGASTAATRSSAAACRSRSASRSPTSMQGRERVTACFFGEGAVAEGEFHESHEPRRAVAAPGPVLLREQPLRDGHRARALESETDLALKAASYEMPAWARRRHGRARGRGGGRARGATRCATAAGRASSSCAPTASAPTRCTTPSSTATRTEVERLEERDPIARSTARLRRRELLDDERPRGARGAGSPPRSTPRSRSPRPGTLEPVEDLDGSSTARPGEPR